LAIVQIDGVTVEIHCSTCTGSSLEAGGKTSCEVGRSDSWRAVDDTAMLVDYFALDKEKRMEWGGHSIVRI
jgi:hypothetical protein